MMILSIVATVVLLGALFYHRVSLLLSSVILLAWTAALGAAGLWNIWLLLPLAIILLPFNFAPMRKSMISAPAFRAFRKVMPPMSRTEKEAIDAGTTWWEGDLFRGNPDWQKLHNYPQPRLTAEEQAFIDGPVEEACRMANDFAITHEMADLPPELWAYLKEHRFFAMIIKKEYGGWNSPLTLRHACCKTLASPASWRSPSACRTPGPGRTAAALRYRRAEKSLSAASGARSGNPVLRADQPGSGL
jgi:acyl-CoA dehydrogenase